MVPDKNLKAKTLNRLIQSSLPSGSFGTSPVKDDGTVNVKVRSTGEASATELADDLSALLFRLRVDFTQTDDVKFRINVNKLGQ